MAVDRLVSVKIRADVADFLRGAGLVESATKKMADGAKQANSETKTGMSRLAQAARDNRDAWSTVGGALTTYGAAVTGIGAAALTVGINYNTLRQRSVAALTTMTGSAEAANAQMDKLDDFASNSPFARDVWIRAQQQLAGFGFEAERIVPILDAVQQAVAATGGSNQDIEELVRIIAQIGAAGKITAVDLMQFGQRGVDAATIIGESMGKTGQEIREEITSGTLDADVAIQALTDGMSERFAGASEGIRGTFLGTIDRLVARFRDLSAIMAEPLVSASGGGFLVDAGNALADFLAQVQQLPDWVLQAAGALTGLSGVAALAAGGFLLLAPRAVETWDALGKMGKMGESAQGALRGIARHAPTAAKGLGLVAAGFIAIDKVAGWATEGLPGVPGLETLTQGILDLRDAGDPTALDAIFASFRSGQGKVTDFASAADLLVNPDWKDNIQALGDSIFGLEQEAEKSRATFEQMGEALASMVASGDVEGAAAAFEWLYGQVDQSKISAEEFMALMPAYGEALTGIDNDARQAADGVDEFADALVRIDPGILQGKYDELMAANQSLADSFVGITDGLADEGVSLNQYLDNMIADLEARDAAFENAAYLIGQGFDAGLVRALLAEEGGALRLQQAVDQMTDDPGLKDKFNTAGHMGGEEYTSALAESLTDAEMPEVKINADLMHAAEEKERLNSIFERDPATVTLDADAGPAIDKGYEVLAWALDQTGIMGLDADDHDAIMKIDQWNALANNTEGLPTLNADPEKAQAQLAALIHDMNVAVGVSTLDADKGPADAKTFQWERTADSTSGTATLNANASSAYSTLYGFLNAIPRSVSVSVRAVPILGGLMGRIPGFDSGGYTGHGSKMQLAGAVHASEFVHKKEHVDKPGMLQFHTDLWKTDDLDGAYIRHKLRGYADGGPVARSAPSMSTGAVTAVLAPEDRELLRAVAGRPINANLSINGKQAGQLVAAGSPYADVIPGGLR